MLKFEKCNFGFTLSEVLITLVLLGILAVIVIPSSFNNFIHKKQQTQIKKAILVYENVIKSLANETRGTDMTALEAQKGENCTNLDKIISIKEQDTDNACKIKMDNGLWWDFSSLDKTIVSFEKDDLTDENAKATDNYKAFYFVTDYDEGKLQILNMAHNNNDNDDGEPSYQQNCTKIYDFIK